MIHYHGTPLGGKILERTYFFKNRHALISYPRQDDLSIVADVASSFCFDNGAYSVWKQGGQLDVDGYLQWCEEWYRHPGFDWAIIPDVIEGSEQENDSMLNDWPSYIRGVPVWHMHESLDRFLNLCNEWDIVAIGSSGDWPNPGTSKWWKRMKCAMDFICDDGKPPCRLHGLKMLNPAIFQKLPLHSADSTNAAVNSGSLNRYGTYLPPTTGQRADVIASRIEQFNSAPVWKDYKHEQIQLFEMN